MAKEGQIGFLAIAKPNRSVRSDKNGMQFVRIIPI